MAELKWRDWQPVPARPVPDKPYLLQLDYSTLVVGKLRLGAWVVDWNHCNVDDAGYLVKQWAEIPGVDYSE